MTFFLDANVLVYSADRHTDRGRACAAVVRSVAAEGASGRSSTAVLEEVWDVERRRRAFDVTGLTAHLFAILRPLLSVTDEVFATAMALDAGDAGTNDRMHLACCLVNQIDVIVSSDRGLDGPHGIRRVDPMDGRAVAELLS